MKFVCLVYAAESALISMTQAELNTLIDEALANDAALGEQGRLVQGEALAHVESAVTVRVRGGRVSATTGPFAETNEQLGGFLLIEAADLDEAVGIAAGIPGARFGSVEVRPVVDLNDVRP
ncbi:YciI family protein [Herbidospora mongoliensis]|uniref:YciI family protein n=1 Tax=Herbidospora mongoliensis TaxID=688067 RepID=UPI00082D60C0|nr:YciI family protein [Herbidospora mongoliensis]